MQFKEYKYGEETILQITYDDNSMGWFHADKNGNLVRGRMYSMYRAYDVGEATVTVFAYFGDGPIILLEVRD